MAERLIFTVLLSLISLSSSLKCTKCSFQLDPPNEVCDETCEGDICFIVTNKHHNATIVAGCIIAHEGDKSVQEKMAVCQRTTINMQCACSTADMCNDPTSQAKDFKFVDDQILPDYQLMPQIQPTQPQPLPVFPDGMKNEMDPVEFMNEAEKAESSNKSETMSFMKTTTFTRATGTTRSTDITTFSTADPISSSSIFSVLIPISLMLII